jgi:cytochrome b involved in lipid metabolism/monoamine oxidase
MYDYLIVGAGISGLYTALKLYQSYPTKTICIIEASAYIGGRIHSIKYDGIIVDGGAARFNTEQYRIVALINELDLMKKAVPITNTINYRSIKPKYDINLETIFPNIHNFILYLQNYIKKNKITDKELINTTILELVENTNTSKYKPISDEYPTIKQYLIDIYPYYSELGVLNALESIHLFTHEYSDKMKYMILNGDMEQIVDNIVDKLKNISTIKLYKEYTLENIVKIDSSDGDDKKEHYEVICNKTIKLDTCHLILTIPKNKLLQIDYLTKHKTLLHNINSVQNEPLYRIYARYPLNKKTGKVWFDGMIKISTNNPIKYIIPVNSKKGVILISYTDSKFANYWLKYVNDGTFETILNKYLKELFPDIDIPKAKWYKHCYWAVGAGYWKSKYDRTQIIHKMTQPIPNEKIYICGENYSSYQAWIEGALETSNLVLSKLGIDITYNYNNKNITTHNITKVKAIIKITKNKNKNKNISNSNNKIKNLKKMLTKKKTISRTNITKSNKSNKDNKGKKVLPEYTLEEVSKHNKKSDAWIVINNKVADITEWIPKHPGGDIIMKGVGKDATTLFNNIGHDDYAKKMLKKYQIGILKK